MVRSLIVDTDCAFDDWLALAYLIQCRSMALKAVTVAATGEAHARPGVATVLRILQLNNVDVPVASGCTRPLRGNHRFPLYVRLVMDFRIGIPLPKAKRAGWKQPAKVLLADLISASEDKITLLTLGPLTNIADMLLEHPQLADKIEMIYVMGGALRVAGNLAEMLPNTVNKSAEWNLYVDYYAADVVLYSKVPITLIPLDVTNTIPLTDRFYKQITREPHTAAAAFAARVVQRLKRLAGKRTLYFWDLIAAVIATHPEVAQFEQRQLRVEQDDKDNLGRLVEDEEGRWMRVCTAVDQTAVEAIIHSTLNSSGIVEDVESYLGLKEF